MRSLYEAPLYSPSSISTRQLDLTSKYWNELLRHWRSGCQILQCSLWNSTAQSSPNSLHSAASRRCCINWQHSKYKEFIVMCNAKRHYIRPLVMKIYVIILIIIAEMSLQRNQKGAGKNPWIRYKCSKKWAIPRFSAASSKFRGKWQIPRRIMKICMPRNTAGPGHYRLSVLSRTLSSSLCQYEVLYLCR